MAVRWYFLLCQLDLRVRTLVLFMVTQCPMVRQWYPTVVGLSRFMCLTSLLCLFDISINMYLTFMIIKDYL